MERGHRGGHHVGPLARDDEVETVEDLQKHVVVP